MSDSQKAISFLSQPVGWTINDILGLILLLLSLGGNAYQWQQQRVYSKTIYNGLVAAFNSIGWLLVRTMQRTQDVARSIESGKVREDCLALADSFRAFSLETEYHLRSLHEQLVGVAKMLSRKDSRWQAGEFGYTPEEIRAIRERFSGGSQG